MPATGKRKTKRNRLRLLQTNVSEASLRRIREIVDETYATPSQVLRRIVDTYFKMIDEKEARSKRAMEARRNGVEKSEAA